MSYQPIQLGRIGVNAGMDHLDNALGAAIRSYQQNQQQAALNLRNRKQDERLEQMDFQKAYLDAAKLARTGDMAGAQALMSRFGGAAGQREIPGAPARYEAETVRAPAPANLTGQMGDDPNAIAQQTADEDWQATKSPTVRQKLVSAAQSGRKVPTLGGEFGGQQWSIDPEAQREARAASLQEALGGLDPATRAEYERLLPGMLMSNADVDVSDIVRSLGANANIRQRQEAQGIKSEQFDRTFGQRKELQDDRLKQSDINSRRAADAKIRAAAMMAMPGLKNDAANARDVTRLQQEVKGFLGTADAKGQLKNMNSLHAAHANINVEGDDSVIAHRDALVQLARFFRGSIPTEGEMRLLYDHVGGLFGDMETAANRIADEGHMSDAMINNLKRSIKIALNEAETRRGQLFNGLRNIVGPGSPYANMGPQVNTVVRGYGQLFGVDDIPDLYPENGNPGTVLGSGLRPAVPAQAPAPKRTAAPKAAPAQGPKRKSVDEILNEEGY